MEKLKNYLERTAPRDAQGRPIGWRATAAEVIKQIIPTPIKNKEKRRGLRINTLILFYS